VFDSTHQYALTGGVGSGFSTSEAFEGYLVYYKTTTFVLPFDDPNWSLDSSSCNSTIGAGEYGIGKMCTEPAIIDCSTLPNFFEQITCKTTQQFGIGILNPSIQAFKQLFQSMTISTNPTCSIPITDVTIYSGYTFPLSSMSSTVCTKTAQLHTVFPIASIFANFFFALSYLFILVGVIRRLTDHTNTDILDGVGGDGSMSGQGDGFGSRRHYD
jgi:hypothetical protein